jgi:hypothetical protein
VLTLSRTDVVSSIILDARPRFPVPDPFVYETDLKSVSPVLRTSLESLNNRRPQFRDICNVLLCIASLSAEVNLAARNAEFWTDGMFVGTSFNPVAHQLMMLPRLDLQGQSIEHHGILIFKEMLRLASIIFLALLKRRKMSQADEMHVYGARLVQLIKKHRVDKSLDLNLYLWVLIVVALVEEDKTDISDLIVDVMLELGIRTWNETILRLKNIAWITESVKSRIPDVERVVMFTKLNRG